MHSFLFFLRGKYPFGDYIAYSNDTFTMNEVKHLWRQKGCVKKYRKRLVMRLDDFEKPAKSNVLCSNWKKWEEPIIWSVRKPKNKKKGFNIGTSLGGGIVNIGLERMNSKQH